jgi:RNA-directed DNA polymerase
MIKWISRIKGRKHFRKICKEYIHKEGNRNHVIKKLINNAWYRLFKLETINIRLYIMVKDLNPFEENNQEYFLVRERKKLMEEFKPLIKKLFKRQNSICPVCDSLLDSEQEELEVHHIMRKADGGTNTINNLKLLHKTCHSKVSNTKDLKLIAEYIHRGITHKGYKP